jgi:Patatin-like phospholipase
VKARGSRLNLSIFALQWKIKSSAHQTEGKYPVSIRHSNTDVAGNSRDIAHCPRILALDGGGVRGLSSLLILREIMEEIRRQSGAEKTPLPCDHFDLIGGTNTGGLIAIMLGRLRMVCPFKIKVANSSPLTNALRNTSSLQKQYSILTMLLQASFQPAMIVVVSMQQSSKLSSKT